MAYLIGSFWRALGINICLYIAGRDRESGDRASQVPDLQELLAGCGQEGLTSSSQAACSKMPALL